MTVPVLILLWLCTGLVAAGCSPRPAPSATRPSAADTTMPPVPAGFAAPRDSIRTVPVPGDPSVRYHRHLVGVVFDAGTGGATVNALLRKYRATIVGGYRDWGPRGAYILQIPDTVTTYEGLQGVLSQIGDEIGVDFAFGNTWRDKIVVRGASGLRQPHQEPADWPRLSGFPPLDTTKLVTLPNDTFQLFRTDVVIAFEPDLSDRSKQSILESLGLTVLGVTHSGLFFVRFADRGPSIEAYRALTDSLRARPGIRTVAPINFTPLEEVAGLHPDSAHQLVIVRGRVVEDDSRAPVTNARVEVPGMGAVSVDSTGRFEAGIPGASGCARLRVRAIGYLPTERTVDLASARSIALGDIPLRWSPILEGPTLLIMSCRPADPSGSEWGTDTVRVN